MPNLLVYVDRIDRIYDIAVNIAENDSEPLVLASISNLLQ